MSETRKRDPPLRARGANWTREELVLVLELFIRLQGKQLHETNPEVIALAGRLRRPIRGVEAQLLMFRNLERDGAYSYGHMSHLVREVWDSSPLRQGGQETRKMQESHLGNPRLAIVDALLDRAHGGPEVAVAPGMARPLVKDAPAPAGVREVLDFLVDAIRSKSGLHWVFLVGGPGNGKSHQITNVLSQLGLTQETYGIDDIASRSYDYPGKGFTLYVVNDATIRPGADDGPGHLAREFRDMRSRAEKTNCFLLANVNRGILVEEAARLVRQEGWAIEGAVVDWLMNAPVDARAGLKVFGSAEDFYRRAEIARPRRIILHAVYLDSLSLLEPIPSSGGHAISDIALDHYKVAPYRVLKFDDPLRLDTPAGELLGEIITEDRFEAGGCSECNAEPVCPMLANARSIRIPEGRLGLLKIMRAAEIEGGRPFTYRDWWTIASLAVVGRRRSEFGAQHPCDWVRQQADLLKDSSLEEGAAWGLVRQRYYESIFPDGFEPLAESRDTGAPEWSLPIDRQLLGVDPAADADAKRMAPVNDSLSAISFNQLPLETLCAVGANVSAFVHPIDHLADRLLTGPTRAGDHRLNPGSRSRRLTWRGRSLYRFYGLTAGFPAHDAVIHNWIAVRRVATSSWTPLPPGLSLRVGLDQLVFPSSAIDPNGRCLLPIFAPRVEPVRTSKERPVWCYAVPMIGKSAVTWHFRSRGDALWIQLTVGLATTEFPLDFTLCREALACTTGISGTQPAMGFTEQSATAVPRLERIRAIFLGRTPEEVAQWPVLAVATTLQLTLAEVD